MVLSIEEARQKELGLLQKQIDNRLGKGDRSIALKQFTRKTLEEILKLYKEAGWHPRWSDTANQIFFSENPIKIRGEANGS